MVDQTQSHEVFAGVGSWAVCSIGMVVFNKRAITVFPLECTLVSLQLGFAALVMLACGWGSLHVGSAKDVLRWCCVIPFFVGMLLTSILALSKASMTAVVTFRALSPLLALVVERFYPNPLVVNVSMLATMLFMLFGCAVYCHGMSAGDFSGLGWIALNSLFAVGDRLLQRLMLAKDQSPVDISKTGVAFLNNAIGIIPLLIAAHLSGEFKELPAAYGELDAVGLTYVISSCVVGAAISYCGIWAQSLISATTFLVLISATKFVIVFIDVFILGVKTLTGFQIAGATITILASAAYGLVRRDMEVSQAKDKCSNEEALDPGETQKLLQKTSALA